MSKSGLVPGALLAAWLPAMALSGCSGFFTAEPLNGSGSGGTSGDYVYVANSGASTIAGFTVSSGAMAAVTSSPYTVSVAPTVLAVSPNNSYLYVGASAGIYLYTISSNGSLTAGNSGNAIITGVEPTAMQVDATNSWLVVAGQSSSKLTAFALDTATGLPSATTGQTQTLDGSAPVALTLSPDNGHVFVALGADGLDELSFSASSTNPLATPKHVAALSSGNSDDAVAVDPTSAYVYVGEAGSSSDMVDARTAKNAETTNTNGLRVFAVSGLTEISGSPFATGNGPSAVLVSSNGSYVYVANKTDGTISGFTQTLALGGSSAASLSLAAMSSSPFKAGQSPVGLLEDNSKTYVLAVDSGGSPDLATFSFDATEAGALDLRGSTATGTDPVTAVALAATH